MATQNDLTLIVASNMIDDLKHRCAANALAVVKLAIERGNNDNESIEDAIRDGFAAALAAEFDWRTEEARQFCSMLLEEVNDHEAAERLREYQPFHLDEHD